MKAACLAIFGALMLPFYIIRIGVILWRTRRA